MGRPWQSTSVEGSLSCRLFETDWVIAGKLIFAACLCLCALTAIHYEVSHLDALLFLLKLLLYNISTAILLPVQASAGLMMGRVVPHSDEELSLWTHTVKSMKGSRVPCSHGALESERQIFCCTGMTAPFLSVKMSPSLACLGIHGDSAGVYQMPDCTGHFDCGGPDSKFIPCRQVCNRTWALCLRLFGIKHACGFRSAIPPISITCTLTALSSVPGQKLMCVWM